MTEHTPMGDQNFFYHWIEQREECRIGKERNQPKPWSPDPILQSYRFCNVRREDDKVTKWIKKNWRDPFDTHHYLTLGMVVARTINRIETLQEIAFPDVRTGAEYREWVEGVRAKLKERRDVKRLPVWTGAYLVSTNGVTMDKIDYILDRVWSPVHVRSRVPYEGETLESYHAHLTQFDGLGSFMAGQVIADLKYTSYLRNAPDWMSWAPIGPGSKRGLNRYFGRKLEQNIPKQQVAQELAVLQYATQQRTGLKLPVHDIQNCCCEWDKYERTRLGEGRPRSGYPGK